jgi:hypothetical protein
MADTATLQLKVDSTQANKAADELDDLALAGAKAEAQAKKLTAASLKLESTERKLISITDRLTKETNEETIARLNLQKATLAASKASQEASILGLKASQASNAVAKSAGAAANQSNGFANSARQVSLQLSQVAQQGAVTGNFFQAFAVQIPDLLLPFGTLAIVVGAVAGALGGPLINALTGTSEAIEKLDDNINDLNEDFSTLTDTQQKYLVSASQLRQSDVRKDIKGLSGDIQEAEKSLKQLEQGFIRTARGQRISVVADPEAIKEAKQEILALNAVRDTANQQLQKEAELQKEILAGVNEKAKTERDTLSLRLQAVQAGFDPALAAAQAFERRNEVIQLSNKELDISQETFDQLRVQNAQTLQDDLTRIEEDGAKQRGQFITAEQTRTLGATGQFFGNLAGIAKAGGKDQFDNYKNLASAQAGVSTALAILSVLGDPLIPTLAKPAFAGAIGALGAVQIAQIQSQEYQPRALGGQMKSGGSFLVGERGPELVTMGNRNANITPNNQLGGGESVQMTNVFQISTGVAETAQAEILRFVPIFEKIAVGAVNKAARAGGSTSRIVGAR